MSGVTATDIGDLVASVFNHVPFGKWVDIAQTYQKYVLQTLLKRKKMTASGPQLEWKVLKETGGNARQTKLYDTDNLARRDVLATAKVPWRYFDNHITYDQREWKHKLPYYTNQQIVDHIKAQDHAMMLETFDHMEAQFWSRPDDANDDLNSWGVKYWVVRDHTTTTGAFQGGAAFGSTVADINPTTVDQWTNWSAQYTSVTVADLIARMSIGMTKIDWGRPRPFSSVDGATPDFQIFMPLDEFESFKTLAKNQNEDIGQDLDAYHNRVMFRGAPVQWAPYLDDDTDEPIYMLDLASWDIKFQQGCDFNRTFQRNLHGAHNISAEFVDAAFNFCCYNRRRNAIFTTAVDNA